MPCYFRFHIPAEHTFTICTNSENKRKTFSFMKMMKRKKKMYRFPAIPQEVAFKTFFFQLLFVLHRYIYSIHKRIYNIHQGDPKNIGKIKGLKVMTLKVSSHAQGRS